MSITALPPMSDKPDDGGTYYICNPYEWAAATLKRGDPCWFRHRKMIFNWSEEINPLGPWKRGTFVSSYMYDGIIAKVYEDDPDDLIEHSLFLDLGDKLVTPEDMVSVREWDALTQ